MYKPSINGCRLIPTSCNHGCGDMLCSEFDELYRLLYTDMNTEYKGHTDDTMSPSNHWLDVNFPGMPLSNTGATVWLNRTNQSDKFRFMIEEAILKNV